MRLQGMRCALALAGVACAAVLLTAPEAKAITITVDSILKTGDTGNYVQNNTANAGEWQSKVYTNNAGGSAADTVSATVNAATRYAAVLGSDSNAGNFGARGDSATSNYTVQFTVSAASGVTYDVVIDTSFIGYLVNRNEGGASGMESVTSNVTGSINAVVDAGLGLATAQSQSTNSTAVALISKNNSLVLSGLTGANVYTLNFTWGQSTNSGNNVISGGDEAVVLLGLGSGIDGTPTASLIGAADDYPGTAGVSDSTTLGHFVGISATVTSVVPEPSTFVLAGMGLLGGVFAAWRRRR